MKSLHSTFSAMRTLRTLILTLPLVALAACSSTSTGSGSSTTSQDSAISSAGLAVTQNVTYQGTLQTAGASIFMEGTHKLQLTDGRFIMLESSSVDLNQYLDKNVQVFGDVRPTKEAGGIIMDVQTVTDLSPSSSSSSSVSSMQFCGGIAGIQCPGGMTCIDNPADNCDPTKGGADCGGICVAASSSSTSSSSMSSIVSSITTSASSSMSSSSSSAKSSVASSAQSSVMQSSAAASSAPYQASGQLSDAAAAMAKDNLAASFWTQEYCGKTAGFCFPVHKNWYYQSFGATSSSLWHVEVGPQPINNIGDGPLTVDIMSGDITTTGATDGQVKIANGTVTGYRSWSGNRHIEINAPASLQAAVTFMLTNLKVNAQ